MGDITKRADPICMKSQFRMLPDATSSSSGAVQNDEFRPQNNTRFASKRDFNITELLIDLVTSGSVVPFTFPHTNGRWRCPFFLIGIHNRSIDMWFVACVKSCIAATLESCKHSMLFSTTIMHPTILCGTPND
ncbi:hypothetical protein AVEN_262987-1 [Araneus ventricosus]|uniref:Uncharacterized protein n=1 Tax=Araneus ventricosus TaxID=182803 RepID=A0A4Y2WB50_ARAVE|nr:hypothetical protein AVEN_262987-1 [Araneus ventricosus]